MTEPNSSARTTRSSRSTAQDPLRTPAPSRATRTSPYETARTRRSHPTSRLLSVLAAAILLAAGIAWAQEDDGDARPTPEEAGGHVPTFEIAERSETDRAGATLRVRIEVDGTETPTLVLVGPGGTLIEESGADASFADLPQGDYLVAATAPKMRMVSGTLTAADGDEIDLVLRLFNLPIHYADGADTPILGIFTMDVADNDDDERGAIELHASPSGKMAVVGSDGYVATFPTGAETRVVEGLEPGTYAVAMTVDTHALATTRVVIGSGERVTVSVDLTTVRP